MIMAKENIVVSLKDLTKLAKLQCTELEGAAFLGIRLSKFHELLRKEETARLAWNRGKELGKISLRRKQSRLADDSAPMAIFLGKQYLNQREVSSQEITGRDGAPLGFDASNLDQKQRDAMRALIMDGSSSKPDEE